MTYKLLQIHYKYITTYITNILQHILQIYYKYVTIKYN